MFTPAERNDSVTVTADSSGSYETGGKSRPHRSTSVMARKRLPRRRLTPTALLLRLVPLTVRFANSIATAARLSS